MILVYKTSLLLCLIVNKLHTMDETEIKEKEDRLKTYKSTWKIFLKLNSNLLKTYSSNFYCDSFITTKLPFPVCHICGVISMTIWLFSNIYLRCIHWMVFQF